MEGSAYIPLSSWITFHRPHLNFPWYAFDAAESCGSFEVGTCVVRGLTWSWGDQDGGEGEKGTVTGQSSTGWASVEWDDGNSNRYKCTGSYNDLARCPTSAGEGRESS